MMVNVATHVRIFDPDPSDDLVEKRTIAVKQLSQRFTGDKNTVFAITQWANDLAIAADSAGRNLSATLVKETEEEIRKPAPAFVAEGQGLQLCACALLGALQTLEDASPSTGTLTTADVLAISLWSALSFQPPRTEPRLEALRSELLHKASAVVLASATSSRERKKIPEPNMIEPEESETIALLQSVQEGFKGTITALTENAALDREELDLLWWTLGDWSEVLARSYSSGEPRPSLAVAAGLEGGRMLRRMPSDAHRNIILRHVASEASLTLGELIKAVGDDAMRLSANYKENGRILACPAVFPLLTALRTGSVSHTRLKAKRGITDWASRALIESAAEHVTSQLPSILV